MPTLHESQTVLESVETQRTIRAKQPVQTEQPETLQPQTGLPRETRSSVDRGHVQSTATTGVSRHENDLPLKESAQSPSTPRRIKEREAPSIKEKAGGAAAQIKEKSTDFKDKSVVKEPKSRADSEALPQQNPAQAKPTKQKPVLSQTNNESGKDILVPTASSEAKVSSAKKSKAAADIKTGERKIKDADAPSIKGKEDVHPQTKENTIRTKDTGLLTKQKTTTGSNPVGLQKDSTKTGRSVSVDSKRTVAEKKKPVVEKQRKPAEKQDSSVPFGSQKSEKTAAKHSAPKQRKKTPPKLHQKPSLQKTKPEKPSIKALPEGVKQLKQGSAASKRAGRTIKIASETTKAAENAAAKPTKTAKQTAKAAKKAEERTRQAVETSKKAAKATAKAVVQAVKASAKAVEGLAELLGVSAPVVLLIIVVCLIAAIGGTCFGIFLSNDKSSGSEMTMAQAITELTTDYYDSITKFQAHYNYDDLEVKGSTSISWKDVLTIYAVKYTNDSDGFDVVTLDKKKLKKIKQILLDMNPCTGVVVEKIVPVTKTFTNSNGQKVTTTTYETQKVLIVTAVHVSAKDQAKLYDFSDDAKAQVKELLSSDYDELWNEVIGSSGEIIVSSSTHVPNFIFAWPLDGDYRISSGFGTRTDPINGVVKTHGGTDIAAAQGTPILAAAGGTVEIAGYNAGGYGYYVKLSHGEGYETLYGHCSVLLVSTGQAVKQGQVIAKVGSTGHSTGPHLHFEVRYNGNKVNPMQFFQ